MAPDCWSWARSCSSSVVFSAVSVLCASIHAQSPTGPEHGFEGASLLLTLFSGEDHILGPTSEFRRPITKSKDLDGGK